MNQLLAYIDRRQQEMLQFLEQIVNIDSGTFDKAGVDRVGGILARRLETLGFSVERVPQIQYGDHLLARKEGTEDPRIVLIGHMDTVFPAGTAAARPFRIANGLAYGPGVLDMKGGLTCLVYALEALQATAHPSFTAMKMSVVLNSDEEMGSPTSTPLIEQEARQAQTACIFEPARPGGEYVIARKGVARYSLTVRGRAAHAGTQPEHGRSAILEMAHKIVALHRLADPSTGTTVSVGVVRGGERYNVIPEQAFAEVDLRARNMAELQRVDKLMREIVANRVVADTSAELSGGVVFPPMVQTAGSKRLFEALRAAGRQLGLDLRGTTTGGGSDGNTTSQFTPTLDGMGPRGSEAHSEREYMEVATLAERTKVLALFLASWPETIAKLDG